jgi:hypothetical protein
MSRPAVVFYVSGHGYGHATRQSALIAEIARRRPDLALIVRTSAPEWLFPQEAERLTVDVDPGLVQPDALDIDLPESLRRHEAFAAGWDAAVEREAAFLEERGAVVVVCDVPPLGVAAAARARVPAFVVSNFTWDWILDAYAEDDGRWRGICDLYSHAYARAEALLRLPMHGEFEGFQRVIDCPLLVRRSPLSRAQAREKLGLSGDPRPAVLVSFGGIGLRTVEGTDAGTDAALARWVFVGWGAKPAGLRADWVGLPDREPQAHVDAMAACEAVLTKPGYGTFAEAAAHRTRALYVPREGFIEIPALVRGLESLGFGRPLSREDFFAGRWAGALEALLAAPVSWPSPPLDGAARVAELVLNAL